MSIIPQKLNGIIEIITDCNETVKIYTIDDTHFKCEIKHGNSSQQFNLSIGDAMELSKFLAEKCKIPKDYRTGPIPLPVLGMKLSILDFTKPYINGDYYPLTDKIWQRHQRYFDIHLRFKQNEVLAPETYWKLIPVTEWGPLIHDHDVIYFTKEDQVNKTGCGKVPYVLDGYKLVSKNNWVSVNGEFFKQGLHWVNKDDIVFSPGNYLEGDWELVPYKKLTVNILNWQKSRSVITTANKNRITAAIAAIVSAGEYYIWDDTSGIKNIYEVYWKPLGGQMTPLGKTQSRSTAKELAIKHYTSL